MVMTTCPTTDRMIAFIDGILSADEMADIQSHIDQCTACQTALEGLVAGTASWDDAVNHLRHESPPVHETILAEAMEQMKSDPQVAVVPREPRPNDLLDFLTPSDRPDSLGKLGPYEVSDVVGQGGMGIVVKAFDPSLHRVVAVKILAPHLAHNPQARKRFIREAQAIAAVSHDHVITIHGIDESVVQPKIVMQYVHGRSLQQKLDAEGSLELKEILRIGMQTAAGLAAAHAQGLVHRDVKPSNILLENGIQRVKLTDFGLARAVDDASVTQSGVIAGTPQYMAPEQANGDTVDFRADLFSLGSVMYAMCVGHSPFRASTTMGVLKRVCHDPPRPIRELNPDIPEWLCEIIMKLLAKKTEDRFPTAKSVAELLEQWLAYVQQPQLAPIPRLHPSVGRSMQPPTFEKSLQHQDNHRFEIDAAMESARTDTLVDFRRTTWSILFLSLLIGVVMSLVAASMGRGLPDSWQNFGIGLLLGLIAFVPIAVVRYLHAVSIGLYSPRRWANRHLNPVGFRRATLTYCLIGLLIGTGLSAGFYVAKVPLFADDSILAASLTGLRFGLLGCVVIVIFRYIQFQFYEKPMKEARSKADPAKLRGLGAPAQEEIPPTIQSEFRSPMSLFKPISWNWFFFCVAGGGLLGLLQITVRSALGDMGFVESDPFEAMLVSLCLGFGAFLLVSLLRLAFTELQEALYFAVPGAAFPMASTVRSKSMQAANVLLVLCRTVAARASEVISRIPVMLKMSLNKQGRGELKDQFVNVATLLGMRVRHLSKPSTHSLLVAGWSFAGGLDLLQLIASFGKSTVLDFVGVVVSVLSFVISYWIYNRRNPDWLRSLSIVALWPFSIGVFLRIPLVIATRYWLKIPEVQDSFSTEAWTSNLNNAVATGSKRFVSSSIGYSYRSLVTASFLMLWTFSCYWILCFYFLTEVAPLWNCIYQISDRSEVTLREHPDVRFTLMANGTGTVQGLTPHASMCRRSQILIGNIEQRYYQCLRIELHESPINVQTHRVLTQQDIESFFLSHFGGAYPSAASSLLQSLMRFSVEERRLNSVSAANTAETSLKTRGIQSRQLFNRSITSNRTPFTDYNPVASILDPRQFDAVTDMKRSQFSCQLSGSSIVKGVTFATVFWLLGVVSILLVRRYQKVSTGNRCQPASLDS